jgi:hypothetical protein
VNNHAGSQLYMYLTLPNEQGLRNFIIGSDKGSDVGVAFVRDTAETADAISSTDWNYSIDGEWVEGKGQIIRGDAEHNVYFNLRLHRSLQYIPDGQDYFVLTNLLPIPAVGFGTGGLRNPKVSIPLALESGYRFLDLAREYRNERIVGDAFLGGLDNPNFPSRSEVFLLSKVWPTELGFGKHCVNF